MAGLYDAAFADITVRELELDFVVNELRRVAEKLGRLPEVLEIGCGNGQLLRHLMEAGMIAQGTGVDASAEMLERARVRHESVVGLRFAKVDGPELLFDDDKFDVVISFLSFRYLDWAAISQEIERVGGEFLMVDMATTALGEDERSLYGETRERTEKLHQERPEFAKALRELVGHPAWHEMLRHHPRIPGHEYEEFLKSRFPGGVWRRLYVCGDHSLFTFQVVL